MKHKHLFLRDTSEKTPYSPITGGSDNKVMPVRDRKSHGRYLQKQFDKVWNATKRKQKIASISKPQGVYLNFRGQAGYHFALNCIEDISQNVRICNAQIRNGVPEATTFVPNEKKSFFLKKLAKYQAEGSNKDIDTIEDINQAVVSSFWTSSTEVPQEVPTECEAWLSYYKKDKPADVFREFGAICKNLGIKYSEEYLIFPERLVVAITANFDDLKNLILNFDHIAEFRRSPTPASFFINENTKEEQKLWIDDLIKRCNFDPDSNTCICLLDEGINNEHPLIKPVLDDSDMYTIFDDGKLQDNKDEHGTEMAGLLIFFNLENALETDKPISIAHRLESVRMLNRKKSNKPELYGAITSESISLPEINEPRKHRVFVMPVTDDCLKYDEFSHLIHHTDGSPSSWSAAIDDLALGKYESEEAHPRLIILSAGNNPECVTENIGNYKDAVRLNSIEDPAQAWNALTVGAYTQKITIPKTDQMDYKPLVEAGGYSPYTTSSATWDPIWPIKPDIVLEGGNLGVAANASEAGDMTYSAFDELNLLTTNHRFYIDNYFIGFNMTSAAAAQAANMAAQIMAMYPNFSPQTIRALMVHSAEWTDAMLKQVYDTDDISKFNKGDLRDLLKIVGYGVPDLQRALYCANNSVNLIIEDELQPFIKTRKGVKINEMAFHELPWPKDVLLSLGETPVQVRVTLSYFIEPSPGGIGWKDKYRYPNCRLNFDINDTNESRYEFMFRINKLTREQNQDSNMKAKQNTGARWLLGVNNRNNGSIHCDIWKDTAANLAEDRFIAVFPRSGWWKERPQLKKYNSKIKYSLIVSLQTPDEKVDLYTPIVQQIKNKIKPKTKITIK